MPDNVFLLEEFIVNAHKNLQDCWQVWKKSLKARNAVDEAKKCAELVETLARETRIWVFSKLADSRELPDNLTPPSARSVFGREVEFLDRFRENPSVGDLLGAKPDGASSGFVPLQRVYELVTAYDEDSDRAAEDIKRRFGQLEKSNQQTWLTMLHEFVPFRNLDSHRTNQLDSDGAPVTVIEDLERVAPLIAQAMRERVPWMMLQAAARFGSYEVQSRDDVKRDSHETVYELRRDKAFDSTRAGHWYARYDDEHNLVELFPRLESDAQVRTVVRDPAADSAESALFNSAKTGCFLPLIGPAFGLPDLPDSPGATEVLRRAWDVVSDDRYEPLKGFLTRVVSDRLNLVDIPDLTPAAPKRCDDLRARLVGELADLASKATMALGRSLSKSGSPLTGKSEVLDEDEAVALSKRIKEVSEVVRTLSRTIPETDCIDLGAYAIEQSLRDLNNDEVRDNRLSLNSVSWLDDLVWHALRWDAPLYPDSEALDLQLLLGARRSDNRRGAILGRSPASSGAALVIEPQKLVEYLESWSRRIEKRMRAAVIGAKSRGWKDPYETLAKAMVLCLEMRQKGTTADSEQRFDQRRNVFIVDATFDQRMCTALEQERAMGAVVYPVDIVDADNNKYPVWAMRRFPRPVNADDETSILWDNCGRTIDWQDVPRIIVLKPFGAPLERIDQLEDAQRRAQRELNNLNFPVPEERQKSTVIQRRYLFDDVSILRDMVRRQDSMPPGFRHTIHDYTDRMFELYFLGYAIDEYGRRARIVADVRPEDDDGREKDSRGKPRFVSHPPPNELVFHYLMRAGFADYDTPLPTAMRDLALSLEQSKREGGTP